MKVALFREFGAPELMEIAEVDQPSPGAGEVLIKVGHAGVNYADVYVRRGMAPGLKPPMTPGLEVAGVVAEVGAGVTSLRVGQRVAAFLRAGGAYAEYAVAPVALVIPLDEAGPISEAVASCLPCAPVTAYQLIADAARLVPGETVLIHGAAGGVGTVAAQVAKALGAGTVIGSIGSEKKRAYASRFPYDHVILTSELEQATKDLTQGRGLDVVLDGIGGPVFARNLAVLAPLGRVVVYGNAARDEAQPVSNFDCWRNARAVVGYSIANLAARDPARLQRAALALVDLLRTGKVTVDVTEVLPLRDIVSAQTKLESGAILGKMALQIS